MFFAKELVNRIQSREDRRSIELFLTERGLKLFNRIEQDMICRFTNIFERMDKEVSNQVIQALHNYNRVLETYNEEENRHE